MPPKPRASAYYRKDKGYWCVRWREDGKQKQKGGFDTELDARREAVTVTERLQAGVSGVRTPRLVVELAAEWWNRYASTQRVAAATRVSYRTAMRRIIDTIGMEDAGALTTPRLIEWHQSLDVSPRAANITLTALSSIMQRAVEWGYVPTNPVRGVRRFREVRQSVVIPTTEQIARLAMTAPSERERGLFLLAIYSGVRQGELFALRRMDILPRNRIQVAGAIGGDGVRKETKTGNERIVPVPAEVGEWLTEYASQIDSESLLFTWTHGERLPRSLWRREVWVPWTKAAGAEGVLWRHLRHYYASTIASVGASLLQCSRWMGHASIVTTMDRYSFLFDHDEARIMDALSRR